MQNAWLLNNTVRRLHSLMILSKSALQRDTDCKGIINVTIILWFFQNVFHIWCHCYHHVNNSSFPTMISIINILWYLYLPTPFKKWDFSIKGLIYLWVTHLFYFIYHRHIHIPVSIVIAPNYDMILFNYAPFTTLCQHQYGVQINLHICHDCLWCPLIGL